MNETAFEYLWVVVLLTNIGPFFGILLVSLAEIILLKKTDWVSSPKNMTFPLLSLGAGIIIGVVLVVVNNIINGFAWLVLGMLFLAMFEEPGILVYAVVMFFALFLLNWVVFFLVRLLTRRIMVKESGLTWKYDLALAALPAMLFASAGPLMQTFSFAFA